MREYHEAYEQAAVDADIHLSADYAQLPDLQRRADRGAARAAGSRDGPADSDAVRVRIEKQRVHSATDVAMAYMDRVIAAATRHAQARW